MFQRDTFGLFFFFKTVFFPPHRIKSLLKTKNKPSYFDRVEQSRGRVVVVMVVMKMVESRQSLPPPNLLPNNPLPPSRHHKVLHTEKPQKLSSRRRLLTPLLSFFSSFFPPLPSTPLHSDTPSHVSSVTHTLPTVSSAAMLSVLIQCVCQVRGKGEEGARGHMTVREGRGQRQGLGLLQSRGVLLFLF